MARQRPGQHDHGAPAHHGQDPVRAWPGSGADKMIGFGEFLKLTRGERCKPHPWQLRLAARCLNGSPPSVIALPTGAGKTTTVDVLVWALAHQAQRPAAERTIGVRIVWAIDRRILVDEVHEHACHLAQLLEDAHGDEEDPLHELAASLALLSGGAPLAATRWRGGQEDRPERHGPLQPQVITSTVAQIGSRLLFRGFGVGERSLALEAGLAACDTTICLDEAHLAEPFRQTVAAIGAMRRNSEQALTLPGLNTITITATPWEDDGDAVRLEDDDRVALGLRWNGPKLAVLDEPDSTRDADCVKALAAATLGHLRGGAPTVACIVNTVRRAREVFTVLRKELAKEEAEIGLLIGPQRPADRARFLNPQRRAVLFGGASPAKPLVVVATQTFEVGLDADVAAMVSESASAAALVQRLGRLNRRGSLAGRAKILRDTESWLYREDEPLAWEWLRSLEQADGTIDVSVAALHDDSSRPRPLRVPTAPTLTEEIVELLVQTSPRPHRWSEPDVEAFLRGAESEPSADVAVCWRCDLQLGVRNPEADGYRKMLLELAPPHSQELLTLSVPSARALLAARLGRSTAAARAALADADVEGETADLRIPDAENTEVWTRFMVLRRGQIRPGALDGGGAETMSPKDVEPGDVIVLPTKAGGADQYGLEPRSSKATDVARDLWREETHADVGDTALGRIAATPLPAPVRITPGAIEQGIGDKAMRARWPRIAARCGRDEENLLNERGAVSRDRITAELVAWLREQLPAHEGLARLRQLGPGDRLVLRGIGPVDADGAPELDGDELEDGERLDRGGRPDREITLEEAEEPALAQPGEGDAGEPKEGDGGKLGEREGGKPGEGDTGDPGEAGAMAEGGSAMGSATAWGPQLRRAWVLMVIPSSRRDWGDRERANGTGPPTLDAHARAVCEQVTDYARRTGLPPTVGESLRVAARVHDHGKADPRIQAFYRGGVAALGAPPIAKSEFGTRDPRAARFARELAGLPEGLRHEIGSVAALASALEDGSIGEKECDPELAHYLTGGHHDLGRPIPRVPRGGVPAQRFRAEAAGIVGTAIGDGRDGWANGAWLERFWSVTERYGPWGAAYLQALLMSADRVVSARGE